MGGLWEDGFIDLSEATDWAGRRSINHFHDPLDGKGGYSGLIPLNDLATGLPGLVPHPYRSAAQWDFRNRVGDEWCVGRAHRGQRVGLSDHRRIVSTCLHRSDRRSAAKWVGGRVPRAGQVEHLIEDNAVPDHARDLPHPGKGFEEYLGILADKKVTLNPVDWFGAFKGKWIDFPLKAVEERGLRAIWDRDIYDGTNPESAARSEPRVGISEYTNANFFAWNRFTEGPIVADFSTLPSTSVLGVPPLYPFPLLGPRTGPTYGFGGRTLPFSPSAVVGYSPYLKFERPALDASVWAQYAEPLMAAAHGYPQTALALALPPARAEIVPTGNFMEFVVRIWNLWPVDSPNAVTWHVHEVSVKGIQPAVDTGAFSFDVSPAAAPFERGDVVPGAALGNQPRSRSACSRNSR